MIDSIFDIIEKYHLEFLQGLWVTFQLCFFTWIIGIALGGFLGYISSTQDKFLGFFLKATAFIVSGVPILVFLFWLHYPAQTFLNIVVNPFFTALIMLAIINTFAVMEIVRNGLKNLPKQYVEVAKLCGLSKSKTFFKIELPILLRHILPSLIVAQVNIIHLSLFASLISVNEIFRVAQRIIAIEYKPVEIYTALGIFFLIINLPILGLAKYVNHKFTKYTQITND